MAIAHVQDLAVSKNTGGASSLQSGAFGSSPITGNTILVFLWTFNNTTVTSVVDTTGVNTYVADKTSTSSGVNCFVYRCSNITGGSTFKITVNMSGNTFITFCAAEFSGLTNSSPADGSGSTNNSAASVPPSTGTFSTTNANDLLIATFSGGNPASTVTGPSGFNRIGESHTAGVSEDGDAQYQIVSSTQTNVNPTWGTSLGGWRAIGFAYKAAPSGIPWPLLMLGKGGDF